MGNVTVERTSFKGYTLNEKRLQQLSYNINELEQAGRLIQQSGESEQLRLSEAKVYCK
jgi:hypothetical protein